MAEGGQVAPPSAFERPFWARARRWAWARAKKTVPGALGWQLGILAFIALLQALFRYSDGGWSAVVSDLYQYVVPVAVWGLVYAVAYVFYINKAPAVFERAAEDRAEKSERRLMELRGSPPLRCRLDGGGLTLEGPESAPHASLFNAEIWIAFENSGEAGAVLRSLNLIVVNRHTRERIWECPPTYGRITRQNVKDTGWYPKNQNIPARSCLVAAVYFQGQMDRGVATALTRDTHGILIVMDAMGQEPFTLSINTDWDDARNRKTPAKFLT